MNKKIAPIVIVVLASLYLLGYLGVILSGLTTDIPKLVMLIMTIAAIAVLGAIIGLIYTLRVRLKEIDKEDDDDLSKY